MTHAREAPHRLAVLADAVQDELLAPLRGQSDVATGDLDARRHPLDVPFPRSRQRLVEVVGPEHEPAVGSGEPAEVRDVRIAAGLHDDARPPGGRQVGGHHGRRAAVERERGDEHPPVPDRDELLQPGHGLRLEHRDRIGPVGRRRPLAMA